VLLEHFQILFSSVNRPGYLYHLCLIQRCSKRRICCGDHLADLPRPQAMGAAAAYTIQAEYVLGYLQHPLGNPWGHLEFFPQFVPELLIQCLHSQPVNCPP
jgi:hypothetical protein